MLVVAVGGHTMDLYNLGGCCVDHGHHARGHGGHHNGGCYGHGPQDGHVMGTAMMIRTVTKWC